MFTGPERFTLRELPLTARLVLALFLVSVGTGYGAAMVQVHFQHASPGQLLPGADEIVKTFHGAAGPKISTIQRLLEADESQPFNGSGSMAAAFTKRSDGWTRALRGRPEEDVRRERDGERQAVLTWIRDGLPRDAYDGDRLPANNGPVTPAFRNDDGTVKLKSLLTARCVRCHQKDGDDAGAANFPLDTYERIQNYARVDAGGAAMSLVKLAQSTHAHLLSFSVLFTLTGLVIALSGYPGWLRGTLAPLVLLAQLADIACWWLARLDGPTGEMFARTILVTGGVVGGGLLFQIVLGLFDLFGAVGRVVLLLLFLGAGLSAGVLKQQVIDPQLRHELGEKAAVLAPAARGP